MIYTHSIFHKIVCTVLYCSDMLSDYAYYLRTDLPTVILTNGSAVHKVMERKKKKEKKTREKERQNKKNILLATDGNHPQVGVVRNGTRISAAHFIFIWFLKRIQHFCSILHRISTR